MIKLLILSRISIIFTQLLMVIISLRHNMLKIILYEELGTDLGQKYKIDNLFDELDNASTKIIMDFSNIEFISRSFAQ